MSSEAEKQDARTLVLMALMALWLAAYGYSIVALVFAPGQVAATAPALQGSVGFLGWQGVAGMLAFGCWGIGWSFPKGSGIRRASAVPILLAVALVLVLLGMVLFGGA